MLMAAGKRRDLGYKDEDEGGLEAIDQGYEELFIAQIVSREAEASGIIGDGKLY